MPSTAKHPLNRESSSDEDFMPTKNKKVSFFVFCVCCVFFFVWVGSILLEKQIFSVSTLELGSAGRQDRRRWKLLSL